VIIRRGAREDVRIFYDRLPFNYRADAYEDAAILRRCDRLRVYPPLMATLKTRPRVLDVGCGTGWLVNTADFHHNCISKGIDFSSVALERARQVAKLLRTNAEFELADLFNYCPSERFGVVTSIGVLHHTDDCLGGIAHIARNFVDETGRMFIGLYHTFGRRAFMSHFDDLRRTGVSDDAMFVNFKKMRTGAGNALGDEVHLRSWFRDQVFHPHASTHTLAEVLPVLGDLGFELESTSVNHFGALPDTGLLEREKTLERIGCERLSAGVYFPGFFVFMARRRV
jgi:SAM-dependent methyltransferase